MNSCVENLKTTYYFIEMSSSRSVASARARRAGGSNNSAVRPNQPGFSKQPPDMGAGQNIKEQKQEPGAKGLSVSDAFALVTIRLGRVEMALQKLDIHNIAQKVADGESSESIASNVIVKSIASRIDDLETSIQEKTGNSVSPEQLEIINGVQSNVSDLEKEIRELKDQIYKLQSFALDVNQKLATLKENSLTRPSSQPQDLYRAVPEDSKSVSSGEKEIEEVVELEVEEEEEEDDDDEEEEEG